MVALKQTATPYHVDDVVGIDFLWIFLR